MPGSESPIVTPTYPGGIIPTPTPAGVLESPMATPGMAGAAGAPVAGDRQGDIVAVVGVPEPAPAMLPESGDGYVVTGWVLAGLLLAYLGAFFVRRRRGDEADKP